MRLTHLLLTDYRNLERLEIDLPQRVGVFVGENAQGKSNILEAIYLLATIRAVRAEQDAQVIRRAALDDVLPAARVVGAVRQGGEVANQGLEPVQPVELLAARPSGRLH